MTKFTRTDKAAKECRGQAKLVLDALSTTEGQTVPELTAKIQAAGLKTVQAPERITAYYLTIFKKQGIVVAETPEDDTDAVADAIGEDADDDDEDPDPEAAEEENAEDLVRG